jgi:hypothetical protein
MKCVKNILQFFLAWIGLTCLLIFFAAIQDTLQQGRWFPLDLQGPGLISAVVVSCGYVVRPLKRLWYKEGQNTANAARLAFLWIGLAWVFLAWVENSWWMPPMAVLICGYMATRLITARRVQN